MKTLLPFLAVAILICGIITLGKIAARRGVEGAAQQIRADVIRFSDVLQGMSGSQSNGYALETNGLGATHDAKP